MPSGPPRMPSNAAAEAAASASTDVSMSLRRNRMLGIEGTTLLRLVAKSLDDLGPFHNIAAQIFVEFFRCHRHRNRALFGPELDDIGPLDGGVDGRIELVDD